MVKMNRVIVVLVLLVAFVSAEELTQEEVRSSYYSSYELEKQERFLEAMKALKPVLQAYPKAYTVNYRMGWLAYKAGSFKDAYSYYGKALALYPSSIEVMHGILLVEAAKKDWKRVEEQARKIITIDFYNQNANWWLSASLRFQSQPAEAKKVMIQMLHIFPTSTSYLTEYGKALFENGETAAASEVFANVLILDPYHQEATGYLKKING